MRFFLLLALLALPACTPRGGGGGGGGGNNPGETDTQLVLTLDEVVMLESYLCSPDAGQTEIDCGDYDLSFTLSHTGDDTLLTQSVLRVSGGDMQFVDNEDCAELPWLPEPGQDSSGTISIRYDGEGSIPTLYHRCGGTTRLRTNAAVGDAPAQGEIEVEVTIEGEEFVHVASASGPILQP